ncbi:hypothetical protein SAMN05444166_6696 [Singulisphaera sp. GP187]|nr:hypothetical protein SAMN05444166_6696 [Singulisphaera sp. GP187]
MIVDRILANEAALQWGHGSEAVDDPLRKHHPDIDRGASMGPRLGSRG